MTEAEAKSKLIAAIESDESGKTRKAIMWEMAMSEAEGVSQKDVAHMIIDGITGMATNTNEELIDDAFRGLEEEEIEDRVNELSMAILQYQE